MLPVEWSYGRQQESGNYSKWTGAVARRDRHWRHQSEQRIIAARSSIRYVHRPFVLASRAQKTLGSSMDTDYKTAPPVPRSKNVAPVSVRRYCRALSRRIRWLCDDMLADSI